MADIFAADARRQSHEGEVTLGADAIAAELPEATGMVEFSVHTFLDPIITVDGDAGGRWTHGPRARSREPRSQASRRAAASHSAVPPSGR
ncbi:nuclear transport factor 2 family protein [Nocardiopsis xinjiangensis]|uniref:hypothetical protein n=1 Tax=Nocardiopsis xinjiangensis TaxID=124285 RepID=UPI00373AE1CD